MSIDKRQTSPSPITHYPSQISAFNQAQKLYAQDSSNANNANNAHNLFEGQETHVKSRSSKQSGASNTMRRRAEDIINMPSKGFK